MIIKAEKQKRFLRPIGQWNFGRIIVYPNNKVEHYLNGIKVVEYTKGSKEYKDVVAISKYVIWKNFGEAAKVISSCRIMAMKFRTGVLK